MSELRKHFHLTLHFTVSGDESKIPTTGVKFQRHPNDTRSGSDIFWREHDERMRRLFQAVVSNKIVLHDFLESCISGWLNSNAQDCWDEILFDAGKLNEHDELPLENILLPAIATLNEEDKQVFTKLVASDVFYENVEEFIDCFSTEFDAVDLVEVEMRGEQ